MAPIQGATSGDPIPGVAPTGYFIVPTLGLGEMTNQEFPNDEGNGSRNFYCSQLAL
jgi:hypothetical protein